MALAGLSRLAGVSDVLKGLSFLLTFVMVSMLGTAVLASAWAQASSLGLGANVSPRAIYRFSAGFTMVFGIFWMVANYTGWLESLHLEHHCEHAQSASPST